MNNKELKFRLSEQMLVDIKRCANDNGQSVSNWLRECIKSSIECVPTKQTERADIVPTNVPTNKDKKKVVPTKPNEDNTAPSWLAKLKESQEKQKARKKA